MAKTKFHRTTADRVKAKTTRPESERGIVYPNVATPGKRVYARPTGSPLANVIGQFRTCWCQQPLGHDWAGKSEGAKHPR